MHSNIDTEPARQFLKLLDPEAKHFTFQTFHDKKPPTKPELAHVVESPAKEELLQLHADGAGVYITVNATDGKGRKAENAVRIRAVFQEDDDGFDGVFPLEPSIVVQSSPGHFQRYWLAADDWPADEQGRKDFAVVMERMIESYGSDKNAKDIVRVLRVPGFLHRKGDPHLVRIVEARGRRYTRDEILAAFPPVEKRQQKQEAPRHEWKPQGDDDRRIREALDRIDADERDVWLQVGMALKDEYGDSGRGLWDDWSRRSEKYNDRDQEKTWRSLRRNGIGIGTLFHHAKGAGWRDERARRQESNSGGAENNGARAGNGSGTQVPPERTAVLVRADSLTPESISWAWKNRFAFGKMAMIAGDPGLGKTTVLIEIVASHSRGGEFPCGEGKAAICETVYLTAEDGLRDTLIPRLMAAEADRTKIHFLTGTKIEGTSADNMAMFDIAQDVAVLRKVFTDNPNIKILVIDPITAYLGAGAKAKENTDVRRVLTPLVKLIEEFGVLLLVNNHLNKTSGKALYRILDSIAFVALGRTIHLVVEDVDNPEIKKFLCHKSNIGSKPLGLTYFIQKTWIPGEQGEQIETSRIVWGTQHIDETADDALAADHNSDTRSSSDEAADFLTTLLADGPVAVAKVEEEARAAGIFGGDGDIGHSKPFRSARRKLGIVTHKAGMGAGWVWEVPKVPPQKVPHQQPLTRPEGTFDKTGSSSGVEGTFEGALGPEGALVSDEAPSRAPSGSRSAPPSGTPGERGTLVTDGPHIRLWIKTAKPAVSTEPDDGLFVM